jgi:hypothetical protein
MIDYSGYHCRTGYLLSSSSRITPVSIGLSVIAGEIILGMSIGRVNIAGIAVFSIFVISALVLLAAVLASIKRSDSAVAASFG